MHAGGCLQTITQPTYQCSANILKSLADQSEKTETHQYEIYRIGTLIHFARIERNVYAENIDMVW
jgi:hypothetical protein